LFLLNQPFTAQRFQLIDKHFFANSGNGTFEFLVTDYPVIDLENDEQCPFTGKICIDFLTGHSLSEIFLSIANFFLVDIQ
jgi:hypothetical protein